MSRDSYAAAHRALVPRAVRRRAPLEIGDEKSGKCRVELVNFDVTEGAKEAA